MKSKTFATLSSLLFLFVVNGGTAHAQGKTADSGVEREPPRNPHLAPSTWPIYHANTYATASVLNTPPVDPTSFETVDNLTHRRLGRGNVSPWTVLKPPTRNGTQVVLTTPVNGIGKYLIENGRLRGVHLLPLERRFLDFDWGILLLADGSALVTEKQHNRFAVIVDERNHPSSPLRVLRRIPIDEDRYGGLTAHFTIGFDGTVFALTDKPMLLALNHVTGKVLAALDLGKEVGLATHNSFPIDERGRMYFVGQSAMFAIDWQRGALRVAWKAPYNMRGPGFDDTRERSKRRDAIGVARGEAGTGSGTTPTLIGDPHTGVVVVVDGHSPRNHLVAFWRDEIPPEWRPITHPTQPALTLDRRVAGVLPLPHSTPDGEGHTAENSPAVLGNGVVIAQWAGFRPDATPPKGLQRADWNPQARRLDLVWANADIHMNGVPTIGRGPTGPRIFGMGREGERYVYSVVDFATGERIRRIDLGTDDAVLDQGNNHVIAADGSIIYGGKGSVVRLHAP
ncbi:MAG: hypothetical protein SFZ23_07890 [Planctomycetota bacterium]|nr:hypothetical protein [Planctomycetota bacterium]